MDKKVPDSPHWKVPDRIMFNIMQGDKLPKYPSNVNKHAFKYELLLYGYIRICSLNAKIIPISLYPYIYSYALYLLPIIPTIKSIIPISTYGLLTIPQEDKIKIIMRDIVTTLKPFTTDEQQQNQIPFDIVKKGSEFNIANALSKIINYSREPQLIADVIWLMIALDHANDNGTKSIWSSICSLFDTSSLFSKWSESMTINLHLWTLYAILTFYDDDKEIKTQFKLNDIYLTILRQMNKLNTRHPQNISSGELSIIEIVSEIFENFISSSPSDIYGISSSLSDNNVTLFMRIIEIILTKMIQLKDYMESTPDNYDTHWGLYFISKIDCILYKILKIIEKLINYDAKLIRIFYDRSVILCHNNDVVELYLELLRHQDHAIRTIVQYLVATITRIDEELGDSTDIMDEYLNHGLITQINCNMYQQTMHKEYDFYNDIINNPDDVNCYLLVLHNVLSCSSQIVCSIFSHYDNYDGMIHFLFYAFEQWASLPSWECIVLLFDAEHESIFHKLIKFEDGYILKILNQNVIKCNEYKSICNGEYQIPWQEYNAEENSHYYFACMFSVTMLEYLKTTDEEMKSFIYYNINQNAMNSFAKNIVPIIKEAADEYSIIPLQKNCEYLQNYGLIPLSE